LKAQITELRSAETSSSTCLIRRDSGTHKVGRAEVDAGI
jgi:hypothetical protein